MPKLVISLPDAGEVIHELTDSRLTIGRTEDNSLQIEDPSVSTHHAQLDASGDGYTLSDLDSTNGTYLNGEPLTKPKPLRAGDRICFGKVDVIYEVPGEPGAQPLPQEEAAPAVPAASSQRPEGFGNASPFQRKHVTKEPLNLVATALFVLAIVVFGAATYSIVAIQAPTF